MEQLRTLDTPAAVETAETLIKLHAIADEACSGFGLLLHIPPEKALAHCAANLLLTAKGSLSRLPKHVGIVLPKLRTPQAGLTLRSLSHHVTFHISEVEVIWRAMPWPNIEENTLNLLAVPWPCEIHLNDFKPLPDNFQSVRYFNYRPADATTTPLPVERILATLTKVEGEHCPVHLLTLPESALSMDEYNLLIGTLKKAADTGVIHRVPMVLAGVHRHEGDKDVNEVRLASYYAGRWYELVQRKHHRWRLDRNQIRQYGLEGRFATARNWYEHIAVSQRRLTFLVPNGWLALCPLICEDLAQLEPVSEVIRGVGPTFLVSLLADGPQITGRWSARYASVLADDPGTAVLTLSSLGMVTQSRDINAKGPHKLSRTVGLWRDAVNGWHPIDLPKGSEALLLTISADWQQEFSADNRGDHQSAATFKFEGVRPLVLEPPLAGDRGAPPARDDVSETGLTARWQDMRELSAATFAIHTLLHLRRQTDVPRVLEWVLASPAVAEHAYSEPLRELIEQIRIAQQHPEQAGIATKAVGWPTDSMRAAIETVREFFADPQPDGREYWRIMIDRAVERLRNALRPENQNPMRRMDWGIPYSVLTCIHAVLEQARRPRFNRHAEPPAVPGCGRRIDPSKAAELFRAVEDALDTYRYVPAPDTPAGEFVEPATPTGELVGV
ncbi:MAG TPA: hypothetical protein VGC13_01315 [Longimicrobium sp.]|uniref:hypothetical protein n=1 Tax=Longimicrobium sp. TaxID=2029185 RepID=UPI002EDB083A